MTQVPAIIHPALGQKSRCPANSASNFVPHRPRIAVVIGASPSRIRNPARIMTPPSELNHDEMLRIRLGVLVREHRDLDEAIHALETAGRPDPLTLRRLKKQKLFLKDQIVKMEDTLIPDIIA